MTDGHVRVRIAVVVKEGGQWSASGWQSDPAREISDEMKMDTALDMTDEEGAEARYWVEASLPLPVVPVVMADTKERVE